MAHDSEPLECLDHGDDCAGPIEYRHQPQRRLDRLDSQVLETIHLAVLKAS